MSSPHRNAGPSRTDLLSKNVRSVRDRINAAARDAGRPSGSVRLIAVTKSVSPGVALALARTGERELGENRLPSLEEKARAFQEAGRSVRWHFIGHLQRNKARRVARLATAIHAVDTPALLATLGRVCAEEGVAPALYLQVKLTDEEAKHGLAPEALGELVPEAARAGLRLAGLMTMAPLAGGVAAAAPVFERLAALAAELDPAAFLEGRPRLSMGMSGDLEPAIAAGAHDVRVGTALFEGVRELLASADGSSPDDDENDGAAA